MSSEFLKNSIKLYSFLGSWPLAGSPGLLRRFKNGLGLVLVINSVVYNAFQCLDIYIEWGNLKYLSENATITFLYTVYMVKVFIFYTNRGEIVFISEEIDSYERRILLGTKNCPKIDFLRRTQERFKNYATAFKSLTCLTVVIMFSWPALTLVYTRDFSLRPMIARIYLPFSLNSSANYAAAYSIELVFGSLAALHIVAFDTYIIGCILFAIARLQILQYSIETINERARQKFIAYDINGQVLSTWDKYQIILSIELKKCVEEHQRIITFCNKVDSMLSIVLFAKFFAYAVVMCCIGFYMLLIEISFNLLILGVYLSTLMVETFFYYWYGNELMTESLKVADSTMMSDWQNFDKQNVNTIIFMTVRSQKPILLTAGKFYAVTLSTWLSLVRSSYSYFALLKQFYD